MVKKKLLEGYIWFERKWKKTKEIEREREKEGKEKKKEEEKNFILWFDMKETKTENLIKNKI